MSGLTARKPRGSGMSSIVSRVGVKLCHELSVAGSKTAELACAIENAGFDSLWLSEHLIMPGDVSSQYPYSDSGGRPFGGDTVWGEAPTCLGFLAGVTRNVRLGTAVIPAITRHPLHLAKQIATADRLSGGRVELGIGAGWLVEEARILGQPYDHRSARLRESIGILRSAWADPVVAHDGEYWHIPACAVRPFPAQGSNVPIWIGGSGERAIGTCIDMGFGVILSNAEGVEAAVRVRAALPDGKRVAASVTLRGVDMSQAKELSRQLLDAGADTLILHPTEDPGQAMREIEAYSLEVLPVLREEVRA